MGARFSEGEVHAVDCIAATAGAALGARFDPSSREGGRWERTAAGARAARAPGKGGPPAPAPAGCGRRRGSGAAGPTARCTAHLAPLTALLPRSRQGPGPLPHPLLPPPPAQRLTTPLCAAPPHPQRPRPGQHGQAAPQRDPHHRGRAPPAEVPHAGAHGGRRVCRRGAARPGAAAAPRGIVRWRVWSVGG